MFILSLDIHCTFSVKNTAWSCPTKTNIFYFFCKKTEQIIDDNVYLPAPSNGFTGHCISIRAVSRLTCLLHQYQIEGPASPAYLTHQLNTSVQVNRSIHWSQVNSNSHHPNKHIPHMAFPVSCLKISGRQSSKNSYKLETQWSHCDRPQKRVLLLFIVWVEVEVIERWACRWAGEPIAGQEWAADRKVSPHLCYLQALPGSWG